MRIDRSEKQKTDNSSGVSEIIGAILLVALVVVSIGIIAALLFGQTTPTTIPNLNFMTGVNSSKTTLYLYHNGGDTLNLGEFSVLLDGVPASSPSVAGGGSQWSLGTTLIVPISKVPQNVQIVFNGSGSTGAVLIRESASDIVSTVNVSADQLPYLDCAAVRNWNCADQIPPEIIIARYEINVSTKRVNLMKFGQPTGTIVSNGMANHLNFTVDDVNTTFIFGGSTCALASTTTYKLPVGTNVSVYFPSDSTDFTLYGSAPSIWEMAGGGLSNIYVVFTFTNKTVWSSSSISSRRLCHADCEQYTNFDSTLVVTTDNSNKVTSFDVNKTHYIDAVNSTVIRLNNFKPTDSGLFLIAFPGGTAPLYLIGWADTIQFDGVTQNGLGK
jgi:archaellum component FlaF (FlaF/FlaG flagellin family)